MTRRPRATTPAGPLAEVFGVRHLSPNGAWQLSRRLRGVDPSAVLIEAPSDATQLIEAIAHKKTRCPIAVLALDQPKRNGSARSVVYPFARYSPEYVGMTWATSHGRPVRFIDLPAATLLALGESNEDRPDPLTTIAAISGESDADTWWERHFEHSSADDSYRSAIATLGAELRTIDQAKASSSENLLREAYMRRAIRAVLAEGHDPARVIVVCGAFHAAALTWELGAMSDHEARRLPTSDASISLMPYGYSRMSTQGGSSAGNRAPAYFEMLYDALRRRAIEGLPARFLSRVAAQMRRGGSQRSSAEVIEAVRLAEALGSLGQASAPTLRDLHDAAVSCLGDGDASVIREAFTKVAVGDLVGELPKGSSRSGLREDFGRRLKALRIDNYLTDNAPESLLVLDRRLNRQVQRESAQSRDRDRSVFLHRLTALDIGFARDITEERDRRDNTFKERWSVGWTAECELRLAERALLGDSVESAAERSMLDLIDRSKSVAEAAALGLRARDCDLGGCLGRAALRVQALSLDDDSFASMAQAVWKIARMIREPDVTGLDVGALRPLLSQLFLRATLRVQSAASCDDAAARHLGEAIDDLDRVSHYDWDAGELAVDRWWAALDAIAGSDEANAYLSGVACALQIEGARLSDEAIGQRVARRISPAMEPREVAGWFEGLASRNPYALLSREGLWRTMTSFVEALDERAFRRALPGLRRAFSGFAAGEARAVALAVARALKEREGRPREAPEGGFNTPVCDELIDEVSVMLDGMDFEL